MTNAAQDVVYGLRNESATRQFNPTDTEVRAALRVLHESGRLRSEAPGADELLVAMMLNAFMKVRESDMKLIKAKRP